MSTKQLLVDLYGPLLSYDQLGKVLGRTAESLRSSLSRSGSVSGQVLGPAKVRIGRRVYFRTEQIARILDSAGSSPEEGA